MVADHAQDRRAAFERENHPKIPPHPKFEVVPFQPPDAQTTMNVRLAESSRELPESLLESVELLLDQRTRLVPETPRVFNP